MCNTSTLFAPCLVQSFQSLGKRCVWIKCGQLLLGTTRAQNQAKPTPFCPSWSAKRSFGVLVKLTLPSQERNHSLRSSQGSTSHSHPAKVQPLRTIPLWLSKGTSLPVKVSSKSFWSLRGSHSHQASSSARWSGKFFCLCKLRIPANCSTGAAMLMWASNCIPILSAGWTWLWTRKLTTPHSYVSSAQC